ncbi:MAG: molybdenum cofactor biosynthesis protein MoaE [Spirochaetales bacterium]|nr:MAG: molybdenum cofactor biosynthesis protein MoaE [Spirochaetales bacterium]
MIHSIHRREDKIIMKTIRLQNDPIECAAALAATGTVEDGAVLSFTGTPRRDSAGRPVEHLFYEAYEGMALKEMDKIADEALAAWPITDCLIIHRTGRVDPGQASILIVVSARHRDEGFAALRFIIDTVKKTVPIWKKEVYIDGSEWVSDRV